MGKDSTSMLYLARQALGNVKFPVIHIDNGNEFPESYEYRDKVAEALGLNLIVEKSRIKHDDISGISCCGANKTDALKNVIKKEGFDAIIVSIRWDEHGIRGMERYFSPRDREFKWNVYNPDKGRFGEALQDSEFVNWGITVSDFGENVNHVRIHPILHWREADVWNFIKERDIPINPLYFSVNGKRFRSLGCKSCTVAIDSSATDIDQIIAELESTNRKEREGRAQDKEETYVMERLRALGYM
ncbi:MAG: phosphoadenosine phosphosulfate reductase family protein [Candidatus Aenigmarchaeota archaeon]|nr:phosphoadenosine phosphosulfate reductase family protein [Candidatus Aenigmarchaeota archaeon]